MWLAVMIYMTLDAIHSRRKREKEWKIYWAAQSEQNKRRWEAHRLKEKEDEYK